jgi:hypothetical protein
MLLLLLLLLLSWLLLLLMAESGLGEAGVSARKLAGEIDLPEKEEEVEE